MQQTGIRLARASDRRRRPFLIISIVLGMMVFAWCLIQTISGTLMSITAAVAAVSFFVSGLRVMAIMTPKPASFIPLKDDEALPDYTILLPLFREANMVQTLMKALDHVDYPADKLQCLLICEEVDPDTIQAVRQELRRPFELIIVPKGKPQTKPRALNHAMQFARGRLITIYDAEDRPHPLQLRQAAAAFAARPDWQALQAPLDYFNSDETWLTRQFALEYAALFHVWVPFLSRLGLPFPLGGTSNHMRRDALENIGGWDAYNVTEDADLSFRLAAHGGQIGYIDLPTDEEAVSTLKPWRLQRSRWIKGYLQSWDIHMSAPLRPGGIAGLKRFLTLQLTLGFTLLSILFYTPTVLILTLWGGWLLASGQPISAPALFIAAGVFSVGVGMAVGAAGAIRAGKSHLAGFALFMPVYWLLLFRPGLRAVKELRERPFFWHKTEHGVSSERHQYRPIVTRESAAYEPIG